ncbi:NAD(P)/FAD-dependent oxidoreductase [Thermodesulfobacteriota bacterium]
MKKRLVLLGGGHAHMVTLANLHTFVEKGYQASVVGPSPYHYYSGMGPGMLGKTYSPDDIRFATQHVVENQGGTFVLGKAVRVDPENQTVYLESGETVPYDVLSFNTGSYVPATNVKGDVSNIFSVKPIENLIEAQKQILELVGQKKIAVSLVGGGPSASEIAGNLWRLSRDYGKHMPAIKIFAGKKLMSRFSDGIRKRVARSLTKRGVEIIEQGYVQEITTGRITMESGEEYPTDFIFLTTGVKPSPIFTESGLPAGPDGGLLVNKYLQSVEYPNLFGGGDCIYFQDRPLDKVGVYAVRQNPVLYHNLMAALEETELQAFDPGGDYLLIFNMGDSTGVLEKKGIRFGGSLAFKIKDYIDRKFIRKFQSIE